MTDKDKAIQEAERIAVQRALEIYAESYDRMARIASREGREASVGVHAVAFDIRKNMVKAVVDALSKLRAPVADERDRNDTISQIVGLCNRIPGATTWNAAQFMYDEMHRRATLASAPVASPIQWPTMPASKGQSPVLFEDGYAEGWAKCMDECQRAVSAASAPVVPPACPTDVCQASKADGVLCADDECDRANGVRPAIAPVAGEAVAWMHAEDPARVISALQKATSERDGGAYASSLRPYNIALGRLAAPQVSEAVRDADPVIGHITVKGKGRSYVDLDASHADLPEGEYVVPAALSAQPNKENDK